MGDTRHALFREINIRLVKLLDLILITLCFVTYWAFFCEPWGVRTFIISLIYLFLYGMFGRIYDAFLISLMRISEVIFGQVVAAFLADFLLYIIAYLIYDEGIKALPLFLTFLAQSVIIVIWAYFSHIWYFRKFPPRKAVVIWDMRQDMEDLIKRYGMNVKFQVIGTASAKECIESGMSVLSGAESVFLCGVHSHERNQILKYCLSCGLIAYVVPRMGDVIMSGARPLHLFRLPMLRVNRYVANPEYMLIKRGGDIFIALVALIITLPVSIITAIAIKSCDKGPVFYRQKRLTMDRREFEIIKFRSMRVDAEADGKALLSSGKYDTRVTTVGKIIRRYRIDEIPQLINVIKGDMSIVGPRPERPEIAEQLEQKMPEFSFRLQVKAGITGYAQVYGKYDSTPYDKLLMDLMYIAKASVSMDLMIMLATLKTLFIPDVKE